MLDGKSGELNIGIALAVLLILSWLARRAAAKRIRPPTPPVIPAVGSQNPTASTAEPRLVEARYEQPAFPYGKGLYPSWVAGLEHRPNAMLMLPALERGDMLDLRREPTNPHDQNATALYFGAVHLGYVPARHAFVADVLDRGKPVEIYILAVEETGSRIATVVALGRYCGLGSLAAVCRAASA